MFGANGIRSAPDGRIYVAQVSGSQISAIDIDSGAIETIIALIMMGPLLTLFSNVVGLVGGAVTMQTFGIPFVTFFREADQAVNLQDFLAGFIKTFFFAILIGGIGCLRGLQASAGASAVGDAATRAVVSCIIMLVVVDGLFALAYYLLNI